MPDVPEPDQTSRGPAYEGRLLPRPEEEVVDQGAGFDVATLLTRRRVLGVLGVGAGALALAACGSSGSSGSSSSSASTSASTSSTSTSDGEIPEETNGPYPADGTADLNVLEDSGIVRSDITSSIDGGTTVTGVPLEFTFTLVDMANDDASFVGAAVYVWQCDGEGRYSMYTQGVEDETFLRGVQVADDNGALTFRTIVPGCYPGRWPHLHFEVYPDAASASDVANCIATSQVAMPTDILADIFALDEYGDSADNLAAIGSLEDDMVFGDGGDVDLQLPTMTGDATSGYTGALTVNVDTSTAAGGGGSAPGGGSGGGPGGEPPEGGMGEPPSGEPPSGAPSDTSS